MHRSCAGLSSSLFASMSSNNKPFLCIYCVLSKQSLEINELKMMVKGLSTKLEKLSNSTNVLTVDSELTSSSDPSIRQSNDQTGFPTASTNAVSTNVKLQSYPSIQNDRKYNVMVFGIPEPPSGSSFFTRAAKDTENVTNLLEKVNLGFCSSTLRDCSRLGHYKRTLLVLNLFWLN